MKKLIFFVFVLVAGNARGQDLNCGDLPLEFQPWCNNYVWLDTLDLVSDSNLIVIDTSNSCAQWQMGHSYKSVFDSASSPFGLVTDTILPYSPNVKCSFILKQPLQVTFYPSILFFEHKYESDYQADGGYIEYSCDHGQNWRTITLEGWQNNEPPYIINGHNYFGFGELGDTVPSFTGTNGEWEWSGIQLVWGIPVMQPDENRWQECWDVMDTLYYRFTFESDSIDNSKAGWMIRKIVIGWNDIGGSISEYSSQPLKIFPNPAAEKISIELPPNSGKLSNILISDIAGNVVASPLTPLQGERGTLDVSTLSPGIYFVLAETDKFVFRQKLIKQ